MIPALAAALFAGLVGSPHCAGMCGPLCATSRDPADVLLWHGGRLSAYALAGAAAGAVGTVPAWAGVDRGLFAVIPAVLVAYGAAVVAGLAPPLHVAIPGTARAGRFLRATAGPLARVGFGALSALLPCGLLWAALAAATALGDPKASALSLVLFGIGTAPGPSVAAFSVDRIARWGAGARYAAASAVLLSGLWVVYARAITAPEACPMHAP